MDGEVVDITVPMFPLVARALGLASHVLFLVVLVLVAEGLTRVAAQKARAVTRCVAKVLQVVVLAQEKRKEAVAGKRLPPGHSKRSKKQVKARASTGGKRSEALPARAAPTLRPAAYPAASAAARQPQQAAIAEREAEREARLAERQARVEAAEAAAKHEAAEAARREVRLEAREPERSGSEEALLCSPKPDLAAAAEAFNRYTAAARTAAEAARRGVRLVAAREPEPSRDEQAVLCSPEPDPAAAAEAFNAYNAAVRAARKARAARQAALRVQVVQENLEAPGHAAMEEEGVALPNPMPNPVEAAVATADPPPQVELPGLSEAPEVEAGRLRLAADEEATFKAREVVACKEEEEEGTGMMASPAPLVLPPPLLPMKADMAESERIAIAEWLQAHDTSHDTSPSTDITPPAPMHSIMARILLPDCDEASKACKPAGSPVSVLSSPGQARGGLGPAGAARGGCSAAW